MSETPTGIDPTKLGTWSELGKKPKETPQEKKTMTRREILQKITTPLKNLEMKQEEKDEIDLKLEKVNLSRRDLLKAIGAGYAALMIEPVNEGLQKIGVLEKGNAPEVAREVMESLVTYCTTEDENQKKVEEAFLKFNAGIIYGRSLGMKMAPEMMSHFIYGNGEPYDTSEDLYKALEDNYNSRYIAVDIRYGEIDIPKFKSQEELLRFHAELAFKLELEKEFGTFIKSEETGELVSPDNLSDLQNKEVTLFGVTNPIVSSQDMSYGLGRHTIKLKGELNNSSGNNISISNPELEIFDHYDWDKANGLDAGTTLAGYAFQLGIAEKLPQEWIDKLSQIYVNITDADGARLSESGRGKSFDVIANYDLGDEDMTLHIKSLANPNIQTTEESRG